MEKYKKAFIDGFNIGFRQACKDLHDMSYELKDRLLNKNNQNKINNLAIDYLNSLDKKNEKK